MSLGQHIADPSRLTHRPHCCAGNDPSPRAGGEKYDLRGTASPLDTVRNRPGRNRDLNEIFHAIFDGFFHSGWYFVSFRVATPDLATAVSDHDKSCKTEPPPALDDRGTAPDLDYLLGKLTAPFATTIVA